MGLATVDGIINEQNTSFAGKDGFYWWIGEVESNEDPMGCNRVRVRIINYYTNPAGSSVSNLPTENLPWATVLQHTCQAGNDLQGESSGQLQPRAIVMGFFMDGEAAQMPVVMGVLRVRKGETDTDKKFMLTGEEIPKGAETNASTTPPGQTDTQLNKNSDKIDANSVRTSPGQGEGPGGAGSPYGIGNAPGISGSSFNTQKPTTPSKPIPTASGTGGPIKLLEYKLTYLLEDLAASAGNLVKADDGSFIDVIENKVVTLDKLLGKIKNFMSAVFAQVVSALRQELDILVQKITDAAVMGTSFLGIPGVTFAAIKSALSAILSVICGIDNKIIDFINNPIGALTGIIDGIVEGLISKAEAALQGVQDVIDSIICSVQNILGQVLGIIQSVKNIANLGGKAKEIIEMWEKGSKIFSQGMDVVKNGIGGLVGILTFFLSLFDFGCNREAHGGKADVGWYPFFGTTSCTPEALAALPIGSAYGSCGDGSATGGKSSGGGFLDSFFEEADQYLTTAKNFVNGAYNLQMGTPGRQATIVKDASGKTTTSVKQNNSSLAKYKANKEVRMQNPDLSDEEVQKKVDAYVKKNTGSDDEQANFVADHTSYPNNHTQEVHGDDCKTVDGDYCRTIDGDYRLKVTGDCHLEVGGGFFMNAQGAPKQADAQGKDAEDKDKIQKHTIAFGSDLDVAVNGADFKLNCIAGEFGMRDMKVACSTYENLGQTSTFSGGEFVINAGNAITMNTKTLTQAVNITNPIGLGGYTCTVGGPITFVQTPAMAGGLPPFTATTPGPMVFNAAAAGIAMNVAAGAWAVNVASGAATINCASGAISLTCAAGVMTLTAGATCKVTAGSIFLN